ncbi:unnamed protein product [Mytilus coruscus]|uniref:Uncharacterized protein n=1 Tax=Mytilus coruscus TaxID=42192 RepID=A0A6J8BLU9_MYTCO|nr:unnamed protein product [Mytilus coruscus]
MKRLLQQSYEQFTRLSNEYIVCLRDTRTRESLRELNSMERDRASSDKLYNGAVTQVKLIKNADARSVSTTSSQSVNAIHNERREQSEWYNKRTTNNSIEPQSNHGGGSTTDENKDVVTKCTPLCDFTCRSCWKTVLVKVFPSNKPEKAVTIYAILDEHIMSQFSKEDLGKDRKDLDIGDDILPLQHSLGLAWNLNMDSFVFSAPVVDNPFTRRGKPIRPC